MFEALGGRKLTASLFAIISGIVFFALSKLSEAGFIEILTLSVTLYVGGNVADGVTDAIRSRIKPPSPPPPPAA